MYIPGTLLKRKADNILVQVVTVRENGIVAVAEIGSVMLYSEDRLRELTEAEKEELDIQAPVH